MIEGILSIKPTMNTIGRNTDIEGQKILSKEDGVIYRQVISSYMPAGCVIL